MKKPRKTKRFLSEQDKKDICELYSKGMKCQEISEKFNSDPSWIVKVVKKGGFWKPKTKRFQDIGRTMDDGQIKILKNLHKLGYQYTEISEKMGLTIDQIKKTAIRIGLVGYTRKYELDENWLNEIDRPEKAIFLGLFFADGCNVKNFNRAELFLHKQDKYYLENFNKLFTNKPLIERKMEKYTCRKASNQFGIQICSKIWSDNLSRYGAVPQKTFLLEKANDLPVEYEKYFLRGYFEGDGCICLSGKYFRFSLTGADKFMGYIQNLIMKNLKIKSYIYQSKQHKKETKTLVISAQKDISTIMNWIYSDNLEFAMERKYNKFF